MRLHLEASALHLETNATSVSGLDIGKKCVGVRQNSLINHPSTDMDQGLEIRVDIDSESQAHPRNTSRSNIHSTCHTEDLEEEFDSLSFASIDVECDAIVHVQRDEILVPLGVGLPGRKNAKDTLKAKMDTGAQGNILPLRIFRRMFPHQLDECGFPRPDATTQSNTRLTSYTGTRIKHYGTINIPCRHKANEWTPTTFYVAESDGPAIIGLPSCHILKFIMVHCEITEKLERPYIKGNQHLKALYPSRYEEKIGNFPGYAHLTLRDGAPGHIKGPKKYPIMLRDEMKQELVRMENLWSHCQGH